MAGERQRETTTYYEHYHTSTHNTPPNKRYVTKIFLWSEIEVEQQAFKYIHQHASLRTGSLVRIRGKLFWRRSRHPAAHSPRVMVALPPKMFPELAQVTPLAGYQHANNRLTSF